MCFHITANTRTYVLVCLRIGTKPSEMSSIDVTINKNVLEKNSHEELSFETIGRCISNLH